MKFPGLANVAGGFAFLFCFSVFSIQLFNLLKSWVFPTTTNTYVEEIPLENMDFPLEIILCVKPGLNTTALRSLGYCEWEILGAFKLNFKRAVQFIKSVFNHLLGHYNYDYEIFVLRKILRHPLCKASLIPLTTSRLRGGDRSSGSSALQL